MKEGRRVREDAPGTGEMSTLAADFVCSVCGAVFTTDQDRAQHLQKEAEGKVREHATRNEMDAAKAQERLNASHRHRI